MAKQSTESRKVVFNTKSKGSPDKKKGPKTAPIKKKYRGQGR